MDEKITRRQLLGALGVLAGMGSVLHCNLFSDPRQEIGALLQELKVCGPIGEAYREVSGDQDFETLRASLFEGLSRAVDRNKLVLHLHAKMRRDYDREKYFGFRGWRLSVTEGQLCALVDMLTPRKLEALLNRLLG